MANNSTPLYIQIKEQLSHQIASGIYAVNSKLPTEHKLMEIFGVGRVTVRAALEQLEQEGKIIKRHGIGTFVAKSVKAVGFEPLLSLSYSLEKLGVENKSSTVSNKETVISEQDECLKQKWAPGTHIHTIQRIRYANNFPIGLEYDYLNDDMYNRLGAEVSNMQSLSSLMFYTVKSDISKLEEVFEFTDTTDFERAQLALQPGERVLRMKRWLYCDNSDTPCAHIEFIIGEKFIDVPFSAMSK